MRKKESELVLRIENLEKIRMERNEEMHALHVAPFLAFPRFFRLLTDTNLVSSGRNADFAQQSGGTGTF